MFKPHLNTCSQCGNETIVVVKKMLCAQCNYKQKQAKKKLEGKKTGGYKYIKKPTGELSIFEEVLNTIADTEETKCFVCGCRIALVTHSNFGHILPKGRFPKFRLNSNNIRLMCYNIQGTGCHTKLDFYPKSELTDPMWDKVWELKTQLLEEYKRISE